MADASHDSFCVLRIYVDQMYVDLIKGTGLSGAGEGRQPYGGTK